MAHPQSLGLHLQEGLQLTRRKVPHHRDWVFIIVSHRDAEGWREVLQWMEGGCLCKNSEEMMSQTFPLRRTAHTERETERLVTQHVCCVTSHQVFPRLANHNQLDRTVRCDADESRLAVN